MQIHELDNYSGSLGSGSYIAVDDGTDTGKLSVQGLLADTNEEINSVSGAVAQEASDRAAADAVLRQAIDNAAIVPAGSTVVVDSTLTIEGAAADAKVTGDEIADLKDDIEHITHNMSIPQSMNLLDIDSCTTNTIIWANGTTQASVNFFTTDYIPVEEGQKINNWYYYSDWGRFVDSAIRTVCAYDSSKNVVSASGSDNAVNDYTVPNGVSYIRCSITVAEYSRQPMILNTLLPVLIYEPFNRDYVQGADFNPYDDSMEIVSSINLKKYVFDNHYLGNTDIVPSDSNNYHIVNPIEVEEGESISTWQYQNGQIQADDWRFLTAFDEHGNLLSSYGSNTGEHVYTPPVGSGVKYVYISQYKRGNPQIIVRGSDAPSFYEDYHEPYAVTTKAFEKDNFPYRVLLLGDSYNAQNLWVTSMLQEFRNMSVINLGVVSATIKDWYNDRTTHPYTSRPISSQTSGNLNTVACQIEKLKRLMVGTDLDAGETAIYQSADEYPNVIIIEGGQNDMPDDDAKVATYYDQFLTLAENVYYVHDNTTQQGNYYIASDIETIDRTCFAGAYRYITQTLHNMFPDAQIFFVTRSRLGYFVYNVNERADKVAEQQRMCAKLCGVSVIDWNKEGNISTITDYPTGSGTSADPYKTQNTLDASDGLHPNVRGGRWYGRLAAKIIKERFADISTTL